MNLNHVTTKKAGDELSHTEWNSLAADVNELGAAAGSGGQSSSSVADTVISVSSKGNTQISSAKHINIEPLYNEEGSDEGTYGDIQMKPGDDISLESSHRASSKRDEITIKTTNGASGASKAPVKLQVIAADLTLSTKGKQVGIGSNDSANVMNVNVTTGSGKGYLKVRAQAVDLRCEDNGGIALQPKGYDGDVNPHMNKIKFEHGGGDGLEFATFNTEKTSIYTDEYRFNKDGKILLSTRTPVARATDGSDPKYKADDATTHYTYTKQSDDFYDVIYEGESGSEFYNYDPTNVADTSITWGDIVKYIAWAKQSNQGPWASQL